MTYNPQVHHRRSIRLKEYDYTQPGAYFVTICAWHRECLFGDIVDGAVCLNPAGRMVNAQWQRLAHRFPNIRLDAFVIMPNHVHGIIIIDPVGATRPSPDRTLDGKDPGPDQARVSDDGSPLQPTRNNAGSPQPPVRANGPPSGSLGAMIGQFKSRATRRIWALPGVGQPPVWQRNYYEHIIRNEMEWERIQKYIVENPAMWLKDQLHPSAPPNQYNQE